MEENKRKSMPVLLKLISLLLILTAAWLIFSRMGFLPQFMSAPIKPEKQAFSDVFPITGFSYENELRNIDKDTVPPGTIENMGILRTDALQDKSYYYSESEDTYYFTAEREVFRINAKNKHQSTLVSTLSAYYNAIVKYHDFYIRIRFGKANYLGGHGHTQYEKSVVSDTYWLTSHSDKDGDKTYLNALDFEGATALLHKNKTESISLYELSCVLDLINEKALIGWDPDNDSALFFYYDENERPCWRRHTLGNPESKDEVFHPFEDITGLDIYGLYDCLLLVRDTLAKEVYCYDLYTGEKTLYISECPDFDLFTYRIKSTGRLAIAGYWGEDKTIWVYDGDSNATAKSPFDEIEYAAYLALGEDSVVLEYYTSKLHAGFKPVIVHPEIMEVKP